MPDHGQPILGAAVPGDRKVQVYKDVSGGAGTLFSEGVTLLDSNGNVIALGGTSTVDRSNFTQGTSAETPVGFLVDEVATDLVGENQTGVPRMTSDRIIYQTPYVKKTLQSAPFSVSATGTVVAAVASKRIKVYAVKLVVSAAISVKWRDGGSADIEGAQPFAANSGSVEFVDPPNFLFGTTAGNSLDLVITGSGTAAGRVSYWSDDAT